MKICSKCKEEKELDQFNKFNRRKDGLSSWCKTCVRDKSKLNYKINKEIISNKNKAYKKIIRLKFIDLKSQFVCKKCDEKRWYVLDFHHIDPNKKDKAISRIIGNNNDLDKVKLELEKCIPLCRNCHTEFHHLEKQNGITIEEYLNH